MKASFAFVSLTLVFAAFSAFGAASAASADVRVIAQAVDDHYNRLRSLQAEFTELYRGNGMDRSESGTVWLKKPRKMRWEYRSPKEKLFLSDGQNAWFYVPGERQVRKEPFKKLEDLRSPLGLLLGRTKLEKELRGLSVALDVAPLAPRDVVLRGVPRGIEDRVRAILLEVTPEDRIARIILEGVDDATTEYRFSDEQENVPLANQRFEFEPPAGVETIEGDLGQ
ncbi:MAG: outer membrane lipoprotein chaperone LolA [Acidobacteria bacterium]|nr:outer membrane lipoprotein chaperone LolA [Acidobacteriota bacterium]